MEPEDSSTGDIDSREGRRGWSWLRSWVSPTSTHRAIRALRRAGYRTAQDVDRLLSVSLSDDHAAEVLNGIGHWAGRDFFWMHDHREEIVAELRSWERSD